jgi:hypothetical protein
MNNQERMATLQRVFKTIFQSKKAGMDITKVNMQTNTGLWPGRWFKDSTTGQQTLRGFDFTCNLGDRTISLRCLEQNPNKTDKFGNLKKHAALARQGHQIMWVIDRNSSYLGGIIDGVWQPSFQPATTPVKYQRATPQPDPQIPPASQTTDMNHVQEFTEGYEEGYAEECLMPQDFDDLPDIPDHIDIPDYVLEEIAADEAVPEWEN